jgi:hypothetical protein
MHGRMQPQPPSSAQSSPAPLTDAQVARVRRWRCDHDDTRGTGVLEAEECPWGGWLLVLCWLRQPGEDVARRAVGSGWGVAGGWLLIRAGRDMLRVALLGRVWAWHLRHVDSTHTHRFPPPPLYMGQPFLPYLACFVPTPSFSRRNRVPLEHVPFEHILLAPGTPDSTGGPLHSPALRYCPTRPPPLSSPSPRAGRFARLPRPPLFTCPAATAPSPSAAR